ncbi:MAG: hypothetical protein Q9186_002484 [Xanthomendoza sp. 1 TL-2023]
MSVSHESVERLDKRPAISDSGHRRESWSDKLNKLTNFSRRHTSGTVASSESSSSLPRRSYIPTPSFGSRTSSLFNGLGLGTTDLTDSLETQTKNPKEGKTGRSTASTRRYSHLVSESTSSFFGNTSSGSLYPREFLEIADAGTKRKENRTGSLRLTQGSHSSQAQQTIYQQPVFSPPTGSEYAESSKTNEASGSRLERDLGSEKSTAGTAKKSRRISTRFPSTSFFKNHSVRHSIAAVPPSSPSKAKDSESSIKIEERRLMAPINPPLPRSITMGPLNTQSVRSTQYSSRTPHFMRPTSSSAARRSSISSGCKTPLPPLTSASGQKTADMPSFFKHRERRRTAGEAATSFGSNQFAREAKPGFSGGEQAITRNEQGIVWDDGLPYGLPRTLANQTRRCPPPNVAGSKRSEDKYLNTRLVDPTGTSTQRHSPSSRYVSTPEGRTSYTTQEAQPPVPRLPQQLVSNATTNGYGSQHHGPPRVVTLGSRIPRSTSKASNLQTERIDSRVMGIQPSISEPHLPRILYDRPPPPAGWRMETTAPMSHNASPAVRIPAGAPTSMALEHVGSAAPVCNDHDHDDDVVDIRRIKGAQDVRFWAGRYTVLSDRIRNDALVSPEAARIVLDDQQRQRAVLLYLKDNCADEEALDSLNAFVNAWELGWSGGVREAFLRIVPERVESAGMATVAEERKKGGFMGKVFGRMKA